MNFESHKLPYCILFCSRGKVGSPPIKLDFLNDIYQSLIQSFFRTEKPFYYGQMLIEDHIQKELPYVLLS